MFKQTLFTVLPHTCLLHPSKNLAQIYHILGAFFGIENALCRRCDWLWRRRSRLYDDFVSVLNCGTVR